MSFAETTQKMADDVASDCRNVRAEVARLGALAKTQGSREFAEAVSELTHAVEKLARCVARRFPDESPREVYTPIGKVTLRPMPPARADGGVCRDCGGMTVPTGACSTCSVCGSTGGCG